jgi:hypothetical protein
MRSERFKDELVRMAQENGLLAGLRENELVAALRSDIDAGARFINLFRDPVTRKNLLVVTSVATHLVQVSMFSTKVKWSVPHKALDSVRHVRRVSSHFVVDELRLIDRARRVRVFTFGISDQDVNFQTLRDMAEENANIAVATIRRQAEAKSGAVPDGVLIPKARDRQREQRDRELEQLQRKMALIESGPPPDTEPSDHWTEADYERLHAWMLDRWGEAKYKEIWTRRIALGYGLAQRSATDSLWFWINAWPALSGLELHQRDHPILAMIVGTAEQAMSSSDIDQKRAMADIKRHLSL